MDGSAGRDWVSARRAPTVPGTTDNPNVPFTIAAAGQAASATAPMQRPVRRQLHAPATPSSVTQRRQKSNAPSGTVNAQMGKPKNEVGALPVRTQPIEVASVRLPRGPS